MNTIQEIEAALSAIPGGAVLDVATGGGSMIEWGQEALGSAASFTGIDAVPLANRAANWREGIFGQDGVQFVQMDAHRMGFPIHSFDTVTIGHSLHHMANPQQVLAEIRRVLRPGGHLFLFEMYRDNQAPTQLSHVHLHHWWASIDRALGVTHNETFTRQGLLDLAADWQIVQQFDYADLSGDPLVPEQLEVLHNRAAHYLERAQDLPQRDEFQAQVEPLLAQLDEIGIHSATTLALVARA